MFGSADRSMSDSECKRSDSGHRKTSGSADRSTSDFARKRKTDSEDRKMSGSATEGDSYSGSADTSTTGSPKWESHRPAGSESSSAVDPASACCSTLKRTHKTHIYVHHLVKRHLLLRIAREVHRLILARNNVNQEVVYLV